MARETESFRRVLDVASESNGIPDSNISKALTQLTVQAGKARVGREMTSAQAELNELNQQFQLKAADDPDKAFEQYKAQRDKLFSNVEKRIPAIGRTAFFSQKNNIIAQDNLQAQDVVFKQKQKNTIQDMNSILSGGIQIGQAEGLRFVKQGGTTDNLSAVLNMAAVESTLKETGRGIISDRAIDQTVKNFRSDYTKSFVAGAIEEDPATALEILEDPLVKDTMDDEEAFGKLKAAAENRLVKAKDFANRRQVLDKVKRSAILADPSQPVTFSQLETEMDNLEFSDAQKEFYRKQNGFGKAAPKPDASARLQAEDDLYGKVADFMVKEDKSVDDIEELQQSIFQGVDKGFIRSSFARDLNAQLVVPYAEELDSEFDNLQDDALAANFPAIQSVTKELDEVRGSEGLFELFRGDPLSDIDDKEERERVRSLRKVSILKPFMEVMSEEAAVRNTSMAGLMLLPDSEKRKISNKIELKTKNRWLADRGQTQADDLSQANFLVKNEARRMQQGLIRNRIRQEARETDVDPEVDSFLDELGVPK